MLIPYFRGLQQTQIMKKKSIKKVITPNTSVEELHWQRGSLVAGIDEAGRGALAGPVVAAAVILPQGCTTIDGVRDSKQLGESEREELYDSVVKTALAWGVGVIEYDVIDQINILQATFRAMLTSVQSLNPQPQHLLVDGNRFTISPIPFTTIVEGDAHCLSIAAASVIAKVTRDRLMRMADTTYPHYGFAQHKGYATQQHRKAILTHGESAIHRKTFLTKLYNRQESLFEEDIV